MKKICNTSITVLPISETTTDKRDPLKALAHETHYSVSEKNRGTVLEAPYQHPLNILCHLKFKNSF